MLVKIIVSKDVKHRDRIIRATNNQNVVETAGLRATDKVQRDIEEFLEQQGWYYERRKNYYKNIGKPQERFVTPMFLEGGFVSLVMKNPAHGAKLRAKYMRRDNSYEAVFSDRNVIQVWLAITEILKGVEAELNNVRPPGGGGERFLSHWRSLIAFLIVAKVNGRFSYSVSDLVKFDFAQITRSIVAQMWNLAVGEMGAIYRLAAARKALFVAACCTKAANDYGIEDIAVVGRGTIPNIHTPDKAEKLAKHKARKEEKRLMRDVPNDVIRRVDAMLPHQPWKPSIHREIAGTLGLDPKEVSAAIGRLIRSGRRHHQRDGVVYACDGKVIAVDHDRAE